MHSHLYHNDIFVQAKIFVLSHEQVYLSGDRCFVQSSVSP